MAKVTRPRIVKALDRLFSQIVRMYKSDSNWICTCVTCWKQSKRHEIQNGHFITRSVYKYRWEMINCRPQCCSCNVFKKWNYIHYTVFMQDVVFKWDRVAWKEFLEWAKELSNIKTYQLKEMLLAFHDSWLGMKKKKDANDINCKPASFVTTLLNDLAKEA